MMTELSLHVLDIAQNSITAKASQIKITISINSMEDTLSINIWDNGCGMEEDVVSKVVDPFYTTRTTRKVGLGIPFFKQSAEITGGSFHIASQKGIGTTITAIYCLSHIDRMPLGDMVSTIHTLITLNQHIDFIYRYEVNNKFFELDTLEFREILGDIPFHIAEVSTYIKEYLTENTLNVNNGQHY